VGVVVTVHSQGGKLNFFLESAQEFSL